MKYKNILFLFLLKNYYNGFRKAEILFFYYRENGNSKNIRSIFRMIYDSVGTGLYLAWNCDKRFHYS